MVKMFKYLIGNVISRQFFTYLLKILLNYKSNLNKEILECIDISLTG